MLRDAASTLDHHASTGGSAALKGLVSKILRDANAVWRQSRRDVDETGRVLRDLTSDYELVVRYHLSESRGGQARRETPDDVVVARQEARGNSAARR